MRTISTRTEGGLVYVKIEANVVGTKLKKRLEDLGIATAEVQGESLFGEAFSKAEAKKNRKDILFDVVNKIWEKGVIAEVSRPKLLNSQGDKAVIEVPFSVKWNQGYLDDLRDTLQKISKSHKDIEWNALSKGIAFRNKGIPNINGSVVNSAFPLAEMGENDRFETLCVFNHFFRQLKARAYFKNENKDTIYVWSDPTSEGQVWRWKVFQALCGQPYSALLAHRTGKSPSALRRPNLIP